MRTSDKIARLEALLERVQARSKSLAPPALGRPRRGALLAGRGEAAPEVDISSLPPADFADEEVEVSSEVVEVDIDIDDVDVMDGDGEESNAPLASASVSGGSSTIRAPFDDASDDAMTQDDRALSPPPLAGEHEPLANEIDEPAPSSSRRPIASPDAYEASSAPQHTPPPESGKQVAAPSAAPPRRPSAPPPASEPRADAPGGWREPGLPHSMPPLPSARPLGPPGASALPPPPRSAPSIAPYSPPPPRTIPPVQAAPPSPSRGSMAAPPSASVAPAPLASGPRLVADVTRGAPSASSPVARFEGTAPVFQPASFGELLDASLEL